MQIAIVVLLGIIVVQLLFGISALRAEAVNIRLMAP